MASTKVRGITIELGADTSGLSKALKSVNQEIGSTQKQLKDVEKLLKLDPHNTELMEQKQKLLSERVGETKTKLEALKQAQKEVGEELKKTGEGQEQYDALQREIISCTNELKELEKQASASSVAMQKISAAGESLKNVGDKISSAGQALMPLSTAAAGLSAGIIKTTADFDASMSKVAAVSGAAGDDFDALRNKAREMGETTKFSASESAEAMNYMAMAGWKTEDMLNGISGVMNLAAASGEELATTSDIVTDALTAFGMTAEDSGHFADILAASASNANTNVAMMGESFKYAAPVAGSLGYTAEDIAVALGLMANSGIKASMAGTSLRNIFTRMAKPTKESAMAMERLGLSIDDGEGHMYSFREIMDQLRQGFVDINMPIEEYDRRVEQLDADLEAGRIKQKAYDKELEELNLQAFGAAGAEKARAAAMLGGTRAMSGLLAIANASEEDYNKLTEAVDNSSQAFARTKDGVVPLNEAMASGAEILETYEGSAAAMAATMQDNAAGQMQILKSQLEELAISLGDTLMPTLREIIGYVQRFVDYLNGLDEETQKTIMNVILVVAALGPLLVIIGKVVSGIGSIMSVIGGLSAPILAVIAVIALLVAAFVHLWNTNEEFRNNIIAIWDGIKAKFEEFGQGIVERLNKMGFDFQSFGDVVKVVWDWICDYLAPVFTNAFDAVAAVLGGALDVLTGLFDVFAGLFTGNWEQMWNGVKEIFEGIWDAIVGVLKGAINIIINAINGLIGGVNKIGFGEHKINIPLIPMLADGGILTSGMAIVGEAGPELVQVSNGQAMVQPLNSGSDISALLETYLPYLAAGNQLVLDSGALVGGIAPDMNVALGTLAIRGGRR
jgi:phage-related minor tail protein